MQGSTGTSEKYGDKWSMTESKIDGNSGKTAGTPDAGTKIHVSMLKYTDMQKFNTYRTIVKYYLKRNDQKYVTRIIIFYYTPKSIECFKMLYSFWLKTNFKVQFNSLYNILFISALFLVLGNCAVYSPTESP